MTRITDAFNNRPALMPYLTLGYPDPATSLACIEAAAAAGADLIELGVPFSDPLADGPVIQHSTQVALEQGITTRRCLEMVGELRHRGLRIPLILMGYYNPIHAFGVAAYAKAAAAAGADGFIVPDLPLEESEELENACQDVGLSFIPMLAPTSTPQRILRAAQKATGFIYLVAVTGVTGERAGLSGDLAGFVNRVKSCGSAPVAVGFGISNASQAADVGRIADGVIIGSAVIKAISGADPVDSVSKFLIGIRSALHPATA
jgi:tryptophan synthase alpha chain